MVAQVKTTFPVSFVAISSHMTRSWKWDVKRWERCTFKKVAAGLPGGPVAKTPHSQCRGSELHAWSGNYIPRGGAGGGLVTKLCLILAIE